MANHTQRGFEIATRTTPQLGRLTMSGLRRFFAKSKSASPRTRPFYPSPLPLSWSQDASLPIPDWRATYDTAPPANDADAQNAYWWRAAWTWSDALRNALVGAYEIEHSEHFMMLSPLGPRQTKLVMEYCELTRRRILRSLDGIAKSWGYGPHLVFIFATDDAYYDYIGNYYPKTGEFSMSSGMFLLLGYGHFVFTASALSNLEPIIAHELTHCLLAPLPLPAWLNEGTAVNMEKKLTPQWRDPSRGLFEYKQAAQKRAAFWNEKTIQQFWSGKSFLLAGEGCGLSYELAEELTGIIARDFGKYRDFMNAAKREDAGDAAAESVLGIDLGNLAGAILGDGNWQPDPSRWTTGTERGQF